MADQCEFCANFVSDDEFGDYCNINLDEDEMARFLTRNTDTCHYFQLFFFDYILTDLICLSFIHILTFKMI